MTHWIIIWLFQKHWFHYIYAMELVNTYTLEMFGIPDIKWFGLTYCYCSD